jgi:hypothetical protein
VNAIRPVGWIGQRSHVEVSHSAFLSRLWRSPEEHPESRYDE